MVGNRKSPWETTQGLLSLAGQCPVIAMADLVLVDKRQLHVKINTTFYGTIKMKLNVNFTVKGKSRRGAAWARLLNYQHLELEPSFW